MGLPPRAFVFLRHGETDWNTQSLAQGRVEVALNARGMEQARAAAARLRGHRIGAVVSSPLLRARLTAEMAAEALGLALEIDEELIEAAYGDHEGRPMAGWFDDWVAGTFDPPGSESFAALRRRVAGAIGRHAGRTADPVLLVSHGSVMRAARAEMALEPLVRTPNAVPLLCTPPVADGSAWTLTPLE